MKLFQIWRSKPERLTTPWLVPYFGFTARRRTWSVCFGLAGEEDDEIPALIGNHGLMYDPPYETVILNAANSRYTMARTLIHEIGHVVFSDHYKIERKKEERITLRMEDMLPALRLGGWKLPPYPPEFRAMRRRALMREEQLEDLEEHET